MPRTTRSMVHPASFRKYLKERFVDQLPVAPAAFHYINAEGPIDEVENNILNELQYQSSLELEPRTFQFF